VTAENVSILRKLILKTRLKMGDSDYALQNIVVRLVVFLNL